jgi:DNA-binding beta-propeller fold protein YncE
MKSQRYWLAVVFALFAATLCQAQAPLEMVQSLLMPEVPAGPYADHMDVDLAGNRFFATPQANKAVDVFDLKTGKLLHTIPGFGNPHAVFYQSDLNQIYVTDSVAGAVKVFSGVDYKLIKTIQLPPGTDGIVYDPAQKYLYVANSGEAADKEYSFISILDTTKGEKVADIKVEANELEAMVIDPSSSRMYVNLSSKNQIAVIDRQKRAVVAIWPVTKGTLNMAITLDAAQHRLYVGCRTTDVHGSIVVIDTETGKETESLPIGGWVDYMAYDSKRSRIYASCGVGEVYTYQRQKDGSYRQLPLTDTAVMSKTAFYSPELDRLFVAVPHLGGTTAQVRVYRVN